MADYASYVECQGRVSETYADPAQWTKQSILNVANTGKFSSDRTIKQYADEIWGLKAVPVSFGK
jgi:starch phosphorylase